MPAKPERFLIWISTDFHPTESTDTEQTEFGRNVEKYRWTTDFWVWKASLALFFSPTKVVYRRKWAWSKLINCESQWIFSGTLTFSEGIRLPEKLPLWAESILFWSRFFSASTHSLPRAAESWEVRSLCDAEACIEYQIWSKRIMAE